MTAGDLDELVREEPSHYAVPIVGREVDQLCIDFAVTLVIEGTDTIRLATPFLVHTGGRTHEVDPDRIETVAVVLDLHRAVVTRAEAAKDDGSLRIDFDEDRWLRVEADADGEAWEIGGGLPPVSPSYRLASLPGGGIELG